MARRRMFDPTMYDNDSLLAVGRDARDLFFALVLFADDEGRLYYDPERWAEKVFPGEDLQLPKLVWALSRQGLIFKYHIGRQRQAVLLPGWFNWQQISHGTPSKIPLPSAAKIRKMLARCCDTAGTMLVRCGDNAGTVMSYMRALCRYYAAQMRVQTNPAVHRKAHDRLVLLGEVLANGAGSTLESILKRAGSPPDSGRQSSKERGKRKEESGARTRGASLRAQKQEATAMQIALDKVLDNLGLPKQEA